MSRRRSVYLIAALIFFTIMLGFGVYVVQQTQTIENQAQVTDPVINEGTCLLQGGRVVSTDLAALDCPTGYTKAGSIQNSSLGNDQSDNSLGDGPTQTQTTPQKICCIPNPTTLLTEDPTASPQITRFPSSYLTNGPTQDPTVSPTIDPSPTTIPPLLTLSPSPTSSLTSPTPTGSINACIIPEKVPQLEVQINYICPTCE